MGATEVGGRRPSAGGSRARTRSVCTVALIAATLIVVPGTHAPAAAGTRVPGIDVSKWQGDVNWAAVGATPTRFAIMRATRGNAYLDPMYSEYLAEASANGLVVGAYHRAKVGVAAGDATDEADHFVNVAQNAAGDVLPVLDIEDANGLSVPQLTDWVRTWLARVYARTGVRAMIYSSPYFWHTYLGDTRWFADHGYPLWIAHWGVPAPSVPAAGWGGRGWTFWQWTSTGHVSGIATNVDRDRFNGSSLIRGRIASLTVTLPAGGTITGARIACGGAATRCSRLANPDTVVTLAANPDPGASFVRWQGACSTAGSSPMCDVTAVGNKAVSALFAYPVHVDVQGSGGGTVSSSPAGIDCGATCTALFAVNSRVTVTAGADSASAFVGWSGGGCGAAGPVCAVSVSSPINLVATFDSIVSVEQDGAGTVLGWGRASHPGAIGGSYRWERRSGASATYAFSGDAVTLYTVSGPMMGRARVEIDGATAATFDGYASALATRVTHRFAGLGAGAHTLAVQVLGTKRPAAAGTRVGVDALRWRGTTRGDPPSTEVWATVTNAAASGGSYVISDAREAFARLRFHGTGASLRTLRGPAMGRAEVWVGGSLVRVVDLHAPAAAFATVRLVWGLVDGPHTVRVVVLGTHRPASAGGGVAVDRWVVV